MDAITIATLTMGIAGMQAGKHVYVEKPCAYNSQEDLWLLFRLGSISTQYLGLRPRLV